VLSQAIDAAREQQARSPELRAATSLALLWAERGERQKAYDLLAPVYGWFTRHPACWMASRSSPTACRASAIRPINS
jgi:hypothetical protein